METRCFQLRPRPPFAFDLLLHYFRESAGTILEVIEENTYRRAVELCGQPALLTVRSAGAIDAPLLMVQVQGKEVGPEAEQAARQWAQRTFSTEADLSGLLALSETDPVFGQTIAQCYGLRPAVISNLFESIAWAIIGQQINVAFAARCKRALTERYGSSLEVNGQRYLLFPTPQQVLSISAAEFTAMQFSRQKTRYLLNLAAEVAEGRLMLDQLWEMPAPEAQQRLEQLLGVGRWTAEYVLLRGMGYRDAIPAADVALQRIIGAAYSLGRYAREAEVRALAERWAGWRGYAAFYWWFSSLAQQAAAPAP